MRITRMSLMILGAGILVIIFASLYFNYVQKVSERDGLLKSLEAAQQALPRVNAERLALDPQLAQMEEKLTQTRDSLARAQSVYPTSAEAIEYGTELYRLADDAALTVTSLSNVAATAKKENDITYLATTFTLTVKGKVVDLLDFIHTIAGSRDFATASIENVEIKDMSASGEEGSSLSCTITIYTYRGD